MGCRLPVSLVLCFVLAGCGTTKFTDTHRSATEQLLISDAMDRAVSRLDFRALAGKKVYLDAKALQSATDSAYLISSLRQHMLASGCLLMDAQTDAEYIVEARAGAVGTDHHELVYGVPRVDIPAVIPVSGVGLPPNIPELKLVTRTDQRAVVKIALFAYNRKTGRPLWQSGVVPIESDVKAFWVFGAGPFQRGSIYEGTSFAGDKLSIPLVDLDNQHEDADPVSIADEAYFVEPVEGVAQGGEGPESGDVTATSGPEEKAKPAKVAAKVMQTAHEKPQAAATAETSPKAPAASEQTEPSADSQAQRPPEGNPQPPVAGSPPANDPPTPSSLRQPGSDAWPFELMPPLPPALPPFD